MKKLTLLAFLLGVTLTTSPVFITIAFAASSEQISETESAEDFNKFLEDCTECERIALMQSLQALPQIPRTLFGKLSAETASGEEVELLPYDSYVDDFDDSIESGRPVRPETFNEIHPALVEQAEKVGVLEKTWTIGEIKRKLVWKQYHWMTFPVRDKENVDYHEIVKWLAQEEDVVGEPEVSDEEIAEKSTYEISAMVAERFQRKRFDELWGRLNDDQKKALLSQGPTLALNDYQRKILMNWDSAEEGERKRVLFELQEIGLSPTEKKSIVTVVFIAYPVWWLVPFIWGDANEVACANFVLTKHYIEKSKKEKAWYKFW